MKERRGILELVFAMLLSGSIGIFVVSSNQPPANVVFFRCIIAFICLVPYCAARGLIRREYFQVRLLLPIIVSGIFLVLNWLLLFKAYPLIDIGLATVIYHVNPFLVILGGAVVLRQAVSRNDILWSAVAFAGLVCLVGAANGALMLGSNVFAGVVLTLSASALYAGTVLLSKASAGVPPAVVVLVQTAVGSLLLAPLADFSALPTSSSEWACLATLGVVHTFFLYCLVFSAYQKLSVKAIAILSFIYPLSAAAFDYIVYGHKFSMGQSLGAGLVLLGILGVKTGWAPIKLRRAIAQ
ncbi:DMT family transporter [Caballeronia sp. TF1N1]|uniref:DMT family transporter n=1 Tax=Caballeronia sp. TF1N1 TaxID=2878153 RepID=UPI001FD3F0C5|nr:DMT family transporter [Caballeronia sp. TF1N1]